MKDLDLDTYLRDSSLSCKSSDPYFQNGYRWTSDPRRSGSETSGVVCKSTLSFYSRVYTTEYSFTVVVPFVRKYTLQEFKRPDLTTKKFQLPWDGTQV